jgi:hypothetical protein
MKFVKGIIIGGIITTGVMMMYNDGEMVNKKKMVKKGKQLVKKLGII